MGLKPFLLLKMLIKTVQVVEWLAKFHALTFVLMKRHRENSNATSLDWIEKHPWIRKNLEDGLNFVQIPDDLDEKGVLQKILFE